MSVKYYVPLEVLASPTAPAHVVRLQDLKDAVDSKFKMPVRAAGPSNYAGTYAAGVLTASANAALVVDGVAMAATDRVLLYGQTDAKQNGIYVVTAAGSGAAPWVLTRADDFNATGKIYSAVKVTAAEGTANHEVTFVLATDDPITLDASLLNFAVSSGNEPKVLQKSFDITGDAATSSFPFTHAWNTAKVTVEIISKASGETVYADVARTANDVTVSFYAAPAVGEDYEVVLRAEIS
ncbi:MAG: hypothetical protein LBQ12_14530 [Deltaproteobacteria bacterium]|jgi:hypothetical protein|nr:hypothetical protein [Deltaproteobacteria bacterium]